MGRGGSTTQFSDKMVPVQFSATLPQPCQKITKRSLRECIPPEHFHRSYTRSIGHLVWDIAEVVAAACVVIFASKTVPWFFVPFVWAVYWFYQGLTFTGLWVIAHECGHGGFTDSRLVNDAVGFLIHSSLLTPYFSWALTHAKHHHYTNHMTMGETWVPSTSNPEKPSVKKAKTVAGTMQRIVAVALLGWYIYLFTNETGAQQNKGQSHFSPSSRALFKPKDRLFVLASNAGMMIGLALLATSFFSWGIANVCAIYLVPQMITNFYLTVITYMQHTHPEVPHFDSEEWTWLRGALSTIDRSMGWFADAKLHHIVDSHVVHHIFSDMPFYGAKAATPYVKAHLGIYYKDGTESTVLGSHYLGFWCDFWHNMRQSVVVGKGEQNFHWFR